MLFDGFDPLDATAPFEVLAAGSDAAAVQGDGESRRHCRQSPRRISRAGDGGSAGGRNAVTHHLVTSGAVTSGLDLALQLLERTYGAQIALAVEDLFAYERRGTVWTR